MSFLFVVLIFCFFVFLYIVYLLSHDDFVILRSNASMEKIFNAVFLSTFFALFFSRLVFVLLNPKGIFMSPLGFLLFPYFPGLSLIGGLLGGFLISLFILKSWNLPIGRMMDFLSIGFLVSFPLGFLGSFLISHLKLESNFIFSIALYSILLFTFVKFILPLSLGGKLKDGSLSFLFILSFSLAHFLSNVVNTFGKVILTSENIISILSFLIFVVIFIQREKLIERYVFKKQ